MTEVIQIRVFGDASLPTLVYLPGLHGDWTMTSSFREALQGRLRLVEITYPRTLTWSIDDYAEAIERGLRENGITQGWLLGESFGSQPAWALLARNPVANAKSVGTAFKIEGLILAAGFVRHPFSRGPKLLSRIGRIIPNRAYRLFMRIYIWQARLRHRRSAETLRSMDEFVDRRTALDRRAMRHRLHLITEYDPRPIARACHLPVHYLAGMFDPLVPWPHVRRWLRKNCPGYRGGRTFWLADHNVLVSAPAGCARQVVRWMQSPG